MKKLTIIFLFLISYHFSVAQESNHIPIDSIKQTLLKFFEWDIKKDQPISNEKPFVLVRETIIGKMKTRTIDKKGVELYLNRYRKSGLFSESYLNNLRQYFSEIGKALDSSAKIERSAIVKIDGLEGDIPLQTLEPEEIFENYKNGIIQKYSIISNKAIVQFLIKDIDIKLLFTLSKLHGKWQIDSIGYYE